MPYQVRVVENTAIPADHDWIFATQRGKTYLFIKESVITPGPCVALARAREVWEASRRVQPSSLVPPSRSPAAWSADRIRARSACW
jgi:hypothetical protein